MGMGEFAPPVKRRWTDYISAAIAVWAAVWWLLQQEWFTAIWAALAAGFAWLMAEWKHDYYVMKRDHDIERSLR